MDCGVPGEKLGSEARQASGENGRRLSWIKALRWYVILETSGCFITLAIRMG